MAGGVGVNGTCGFYVADSATASGSAKASAGTTVGATSSAGATDADAAAAGGSRCLLSLLLLLF
jgi:hypothetical protein